MDKMKILRRIHRFPGVSSKTAPLPTHLAHARRYRTLHTTTRVFDIPQWPNPPVPQPAATPYDAGGSEKSNFEGGKNSAKGSVYAELAASPIVQAAVTTAIGLGQSVGFVRQSVADLCCLQSLYSLEVSDISLITKRTS